MIEEKIQKLNAKSKLADETEFRAELDIDRGL